jgi:hypothetical protein
VKGQKPESLILQRIWEQASKTLDIEKLMMPAASGWTFRCQ